MTKKEMLEKIDPYLSYVDMDFRKKLDDENSVITEKEFTEKYNEAWNDSYDHVIISGQLEARRKSKLTPKK